MKPFNLEAAKRGEPIQCRNGTSARFIAHVPEVGNERSVVALVGDNIQLFFENGTPFKTSVGGNYDLVMAPKKRTVWVNFYQSVMFGEVASSAFNTQCEADRENEMHNKDRQRMGGRAYPVEIEE